MRMDYPWRETRLSLLERLKDWDDQSSWRDFFDTYARLIYSTARGSGLSDGEAQEIVQETLVVVAKQMREFRYDPERASFKGWLKTIVRRRVADHFRKGHRLRGELVRRDDESADGAELDGLPASPSSDPDALWEADWRRNLLERATEIVRGRVRPKQFQIFDLHVLREMPVQDVCHTLKCSVAQVYLARHRVTKLIRAEVERLERDHF